VMRCDGAVVPVEDIVAGDLLMGPDSLPRRVISTCQGVEPLYRVVPTKGEPYVVNESHILSVKLTPRRHGEKHALQAISVTDYLAACSTFKHRAKGWRAAIDWDHRAVPVDPYLLGLWLGDGTSAEPSFTTQDPEIVDYLVQGRTGRGHIHPFRAALWSLGLMPEKFVPLLYRANSREIRSQVLAGIIDTDGYCHHKGCDLVFKARQLADDTAFLSRSLGLAAYVSECQKTCTNTGATGTYWRVNISGDFRFLPLRVPRRIVEGRQQIKSVNVTGIRLEPIGPGEYFGFELSGPDRLFLLGDFTVTHNTTIFSHLIGQEARRGGRSLILAHRDELLDQAADRIASMTDVRVDIEGGDRRAIGTAEAVVASVQTIGRSGSSRLGWLRPTLIVTDECHHAPADTYQVVYKRFGCHGENPPFHLGVTATAHRMDNRPLHGGEAIYEAVLFEYGIKPMIVDGWLCDIRSYRCDASYSLRGVKITAGGVNQKAHDKKVNTDRNNKEAYYHWRAVASDRRTIVFCTSVAHAHAMADLFVGCGVTAEAVDGAMDKGLRAAVMARFKSGQTQVLTNCNVATEGFDCPEAACILLLRPTKSWSLFVQMIGRGLRISPGKQDCIVIDVDGAGDDKSLASVPSVLGLPHSAKQEGGSFKQLMIRVDELPEDMRARLGRKPFDLTSIDTVLAEVDLLRDLDPPAEVLRGSQWAWQVVADGWYSLWCGSDETKAKVRKATLRSDALGAWTLTLVEGDDGPPPEVVHEGIEPDKALCAADNAIRIAWPGLDGFLRRDAPWRNKTGCASEKQKFWLRKFGLTDAEIAQMTRSEVSTFLDRQFSKRRR